ncbi:MAG: S-methyl-5'-thioadenosine phosphorylase [Elusimicrobia bacterium]|nr:S-methyl-5'-thioadenosine phosphorylase [Elusimicrobiota bacterium]
MSKPKVGPVEIAFIGGSGLYEVSGIENVEEISVDTPFGNPSDKIIVGVIDGVPCAFLPRHAKSHVYLPGEIPQKANMYALKSLGVKKIVAFAACGSLKREIKPKDFVIPDQLFDRTRNRPHTFFGEGIVAHVGMAKPFCDCLRDTIHKSVAELAIEHHFEGTYVCIEGPQFSTKAESEVNRAHGFSVVGMTAMPEARLAREAEMCYANVSLVTDFDVWKEGEEVTNDSVLLAMQSNVNNAKKVIRNIVPKLAGLQCNCGCQDALSSAIMTSFDRMNKETYKKLSFLLDKYKKG